MKRHYSGDDSNQFWKAVNSLKGEKRERAYRMGTVLQNMEHETLRQLDAALRAQKRRKPAKRK